MSRSVQSEKPGGRRVRRVALAVAGSAALAAAGLAGGAAGTVGSARQLTTRHLVAGRSAPLASAHPTLARLAVGRRVAFPGTPASRPVDLRRLPLLEASLGESSNWSGYGGLTTAGTGVAADWVVPDTATSATERYSATWVGVDGIVTAPLLQAGTEQDSRTEPGAGSRYFAWVESLPAPPTELVNPTTHRPYVVRPGDTVGVAIFPTATTGLLGSSTTSWTVDIGDKTRGWSVSIPEASYKGSGGSAEWIEEAPTLVSSSDPKGTITTMADFSSVRFLATALYGDSTWFGTKLTKRDGIELIQDSSGRTVTVARPGGPAASTLSSSTQRFVDYYVTSPTSVRATPGAGSATVAWNPPAATGEASVIGYLVRVYRAGELAQTITVHGSATRTVVSGLTPGVPYTFSVSAQRTGSIASTFSPRSAAVKPLG